MPRMLFRQRYGFLRPAPAGLLVMVLLSTPVLPAEMTSEIALERARVWLAAELKLDARRLDAASVEARTWPNGSLGCPRSGEMYTQAIVSGYQVVFTVGAAQYQVHVGPDAIRRCDQLQRAKIIEKTNMASLARVADGARRELAHQLAVSAKRIKVENVVKAIAADRNAECAQADFVVTLNHRGERHRLLAESSTGKYCRLAR